MDKSQFQNPERKISADEQKIRFDIEKNTETVERRELSKDELESIKEELRREIVAMDSDPGLKLEAEQKAKKIGSLSINEMMEHLVEMAEKRGLKFAISVARKMNDPFILDTFHDLLAREGYYKKFAK